MGIPSPMLKIFNHLPEAVEAFEVFLVELLQMACGIGQGPILLELMKTRIFSAHRYQWVCLLTPPPHTHTHTLGSQRLYSVLNTIYAFLLFCVV